MNHHEHGGVVLAGQSLQLCLELGGNGERDLSTGNRPLVGTRPVGRQVEQLGHSREVLTPERDLP